MTIRKLLYPIALLILIVACYFIMSKDNKPEIQIIESHGDPIADFTDKRNLVGTADFVFLAEVRQFLDQTEDLKPISTFEVEILANIKGELKERIVKVRQYGGYIDESGEKLLRIYENDPLIQPNQKYVFSSIQQKDGSLLLIPGYGSELVENGDREKELLSAYSDAFNNQVVPELKKRTQKPNE